MCSFCSILSSKTNLREKKRQELLIATLVGHVASVVASIARARNTQIKSATSCAAAAPLSALSQPHLQVDVYAAAVSAVAGAPNSQSREDDTYTSPRWAASRADLAA